MLLTSVIQDSFQEYEGHHALVLFAQGCNLRCAECYNLKEITNPTKNIGQAREVIDQYLTPLHDAVVFLGGEPTIHPDLPALADYVRSLRLSRKVYTNGLNPDMVERLNDAGLIDSYSVDFKTIDDSSFLGMNIPLSVYLKNVTLTIEDILEHGIDLEIRTTKWTGVNVEGIKKFLHGNYPQVRHIVQDKFEVA